QVPTTWYYDEPFFLGGSGGTTRRLDGVHRDDPNTNLYRGNWGAVHKGAAQFLFADGSIRTIPYDTPKEVVRGAMTPAGGEVPPTFRMPTVASAEACNLLHRHGDSPCAHRRSAPRPRR